MTAADIAKSLGITPSEVRRKLLGRGFVDRIKTQGYQVHPIALVNKTNDLEFTEVLLDVQASRFFVGKYDSPRGDSYLAYLLKIEQRVEELDAEVRADPLLRSIMQNASLRRNQVRQEKALKEQAQKVSLLEDKTASLDQAILDSQLSQVQKRLLKASIDARAKSLGSIKYAGAIQRDLKEKFGLNKTNDKWYHLAQRHYEEANNFIGGWGY